MEWLKDYNLILVSGSPRRKELMEKSGFIFETRYIDVEESFPDSLSIDDIALFLANKKFNASLQFAKLDNDIIITADTVVVKEDRLLGKPRDLADAKDKLQMLSNSWHEVITGVCIGNKQKKDCFSVVSRVVVDILDDSEIDYYINNYQVLDKAGAYGIQDWFGLTKIPYIDGSYSNIMGLPTKILYDKLKVFLLK